MVSASFYEQNTHWNPKCCERSRSSSQWAASNSYTLPRGMGPQALSIPRSTQIPFWAQPTWGGTGEDHQPYKILIPKEASSAFCHGFEQLLQYRFLTTLSMSCSHSHCPSKDVHQAPLLHLAPVDPTPALLWACKLRQLSGQEATP